MRSILVIVAAVTALSLAGCPDKSKTDEEASAAEGQADGESGEKPPDETIEKLKSLGYIQ